MELCKDKACHQEALVLALVVVGAFLVRLYCMRYHPVMVPDYDGAEYLTLGQGVFSGRPCCTPLVSPGFPVLLALALPFFGDPQTAGMFVSAAFGASLTAAVYLLTRELFDRKTAFAASVMTASFGQLVIASTWVMAEMPFAFFLYMGMYAAVIFMRRGGRLSAAAAGMLFGAAYLIRPDTMAILVAVWLFVGVWACRRKTVTPRRLGIGLGLSLGLFLLAAVPYMAYVRAGGGGWTVSGKLAYNLESGGPPAVAPGSEGALRYALGHPGALLAKYGRNVRVLLDVLAEEFPIPLIVLAAFGMAASALLCRGRPIGFCCPMLLGLYASALPLFFVDERALVTGVRALSTLAVDYLAGK